MAPPEAGTSGEVSRARWMCRGQTGDGVVIGMVTGREGGIAADGGGRDAILGANLPAGQPSAMVATTWGERRAAGRGKGGTGGKGERI